MQKPPNKFEQDIFLAESIPAGPKQRYLAMTIDSILIAILAGFLASLKGIKDPKLIMQLNGFVTIAYYTLLQWQYGFTVGKKVMKLQLVSVDGGKLNFMNVLLRETLGRLISLAVFALGFVWIFCNKQRRGWHDLMSRTQVISIDPMAQEPSPGAWIKFAATMGIMLAISGGILYAALFSPLPIKKIAQNLELAGFEVTNPHGSIARGIKIDRISVSGTANDFSLEKVTLKLGLLDLMKNKIVVKELTINGGKVHAPDVFNPMLLVALAASPPKTKSIEEAAPPPMPEPQAQTNGFKPKPISQFLFKKIDISNFEVVFSPVKKLNLTRFLVDNLMIEKGKGQLDRVWIQSSAFDLDLGGVTANKDQVVAQRIRGTVKQTTFPEYLAQDLDFEGGFDFSLEDRKFGKLAVGLCERRLQLTGQGQSFKIQTYDLSPSKCMRPQVPLNRLNMTVAINGPRFVPEIQNASVMVRNVPFKYMTGYGFMHTRGPKTYLFDFTAASIVQMVTGKTPSFKILSNSIDDSEWLSELYFDKPKMQLTSAEGQIIENDRTIFQSPGATQNMEMRIPASGPTDAQ